MEEPHLQSISFRRNLHQGLPFFPCTIGVENVAEGFPHFLRGKNPYVADAEYYHRMAAPNGDVWLTVVAEIVDADNLREPFVQNTHFKKLPANAPFTPEACEAS